MKEGLIIKFLRQEKKLSQKALAEGICTIRHLRNIEKGRVNPTYYLICKMAERLGEDLHLMINHDVQKYGLNLFKKIREIELLLRQWEFEKLKVEVDSILNNQEIILSTPLYRRLKYYKAICSKENYKEYKGAKDILFEILECNSLKDVDEFLKTSLCNEIEFNICNAIAVNEAYNGDEKQALILLILLEKSMRKSGLIRSEYLTKVIYNIIRISYNLELYEQAINYAKQNIEICKSNKYVRFLTGTYMYLANSMKMNSPNSNYQVYYKKFIYLGYFFSDEVKMEKAIDNIISQNEIDIDIDFLKAEL